MVADANLSEAGIKKMLSLRWTGKPDKINASKVRKEARSRVLFLDAQAAKVLAASLSLMMQKYLHRQFTCYLCHRQATYVP